MLRFEIITSELWIIYVMVEKNVIRDIIYLKSQTGMVLNKRNESI
jgi:hypothetical protein